jgi:hypothetical protein
MDSTMFALGVVAFLAVKFSAYYYWCARGLRVLAVENVGTSSAGRAAVLASIRVGIGIVLGALLLFAVSHVAPARTRMGFSFPVFLFGAVILRWLEWSFIGTLAANRANTIRGILVGKGRREHIWRAGGVAVSFATDVGNFLGVGALGLVAC